MDECLQIILRKQEDDINYEAVLQTYCGGWGDVSYGCGCTQSDALQLNQNAEWKLIWTFQQDDLMQ